MNIKTTTALILIAVPVLGVTAIALTAVAPDHCSTKGLTGCTTCRSDAAFSAMRKQDEALMAKWPPGEVDWFDEKRALWANLQTQARQTGDHAAACRAMKKFEAARDGGGHN